MVYYHDTLQLCRTGYDDVSLRRMTTHAFLHFELFPLDCTDSISRLLHNLNTLCYIIMILHRYVEQVLTMCFLQE